MRQSPTPRGDSRERAHGHRRAARPDTHVSHDSVRSRRVDRVSREADAASRGRGEAHGHEASKPRRSPREVVTSAASFVRGHRIPFIVMGVVLLVAASLYGPARDAHNSDELLTDLAKRGLRPEVIAGSIEGSLTFLGVAQDFGQKSLLVADSGGGSTELAIGRLTADEKAPGSYGLSLAWVRSVDVGARRATERYLAKAPTPADTVAAVREWAREEFSRALAERGDVGVPDTLVATGGTATTLVALDAGLDPYDSRFVHLKSLSARSVDALLARLAPLSVPERAKLKGIQSKRAPVILGGIAVISALLEATGATAMTVSESDLLFGLAICAAAAVEGVPAPFGWKPELVVLR